MTVMAGLSRTNGHLLGGDAHLRQSIADILGTPIGTRVMRRDYGSLLFDLLDQPVNARTKLRLFAAIAVALLRWEPRLRITRLSLDAASDGSWSLLLDGERTDTGDISPFTRLTLPLRPILT